MENKDKASLMTRDQRYAVAEDAIAGAFFLICREKDPDRITVADITKKAGIVRSTFYNHYVDMPALVGAMETRVAEDIFKLMDQFKAGGVDIYYAYFLGITRYAVDNGFLLWHLRDTSVNSAFLEKLVMMFHRYAKKLRAVQNTGTSVDRDEAYAVAYSIGGVLGILHKWAVDGCAESPENIAGVTSRIFLYGMRPFGM